MNNVMFQYVHRREARGRGRGSGAMGRAGTCDATQAAGSPHTHDSRASRLSPSPN